MSSQHSKIKLLELGKKNAEWIRSGGLKQSQDVSQIESVAHEYLAKMNERGFITFDSQCGIKKEERAYVSGFMDRKTAVRFNEEFNLHTNLISFVVIPGNYDSLYRIPVTYEMENRKRVGVTRFPYRLEAKAILFEKKNANIPGAIMKDVVLVECMDVQWGRNCSKYLFKEILKYLL